LPHVLWQNLTTRLGFPTTQATLPSADHAAEIARLQRENERLRMERGILKKPIANLLHLTAAGG
jgi:transposase-like protein